MSKSHMKTEELLYEKHFPFKLVKGPFLPLVKSVSEWDTAVLHKNQKNPPKEQQISYCTVYSKAILTGKEKKVLNNKKRCALPKVSDRKLGH